MRVQKARKSSGSRLRVKVPQSIADRILDQTVSDLVFLAVGIIGTLLETSNAASAKARRSLRGLANICNALGKKRSNEFADTVARLRLDDKGVEAFLFMALGVLGRLIHEEDKGSADAGKALWGLASICRGLEGQRKAPPSR